MSLFLYVIITLTDSERCIKMQQIVQIKNEMNTIPLKNFSSVEQDLFFTLCSRLRNEDTKKIRFDITELKELSKYSSTSNSRFAKDLESLYDKILQVTYKVGSDQHFKKFTLFTDYEVNMIEGYLDISVNENFKHLLNNFEIGQFTIFELNELTSFRSNYTKNLYRLLKQFKSTGYMKVSMNRFREVLCIPSSYRMSDINKRVLNPALKEFENVFFNLSYNKIPSKTDGRTIEAIEFNFLPQKNIKPIAKEKFKQSKETSQNKPVAGDKDEKEMEKALLFGDYIHLNPMYQLIQDREKDH